MVFKRLSLASVPWQPGVGFVLGDVKAPRGNVSRQIYNLSRKINEVSLGSSLIFMELGLAIFCFMLKNLGKNHLKGFKGMKFHNSGVLT